MERLFRASERKLSTLDDRFQRFMLPILDTDERLVGIKGARGGGKTTMLLQHLKQQRADRATMLYASLDDLYFQQDTLVDMAEEFYINGGRTLYLDEVHKYPNWSVELKNIYDTYVDMQVIFTSSSILEIHQGEADLSRRAVIYGLPAMSFREYLELAHDIRLEVMPLEDILRYHIDLSREIASRMSIIPYFKEYLRHGSYPYFMEGAETYLQKLASTVNLILEVDVPSIQPITYATVHKLKKLLAFITTSTPFKPNVAEMARLIETKARISVLGLLDTLDKATLIALLQTSAKGKGALSKPDKIYMGNCNLIHALGGDTSDIGTMRETFFLDQLSYRHDVKMSPAADFLVDGRFTFEVGGKNKGRDQIKGMEEAYIAADNMEVGYRNKIPLWMFGLTY